jgi:hypothetical protein
MNDKNVDLKDSSKNWLQKLKDESWEAELLVSTISIFGAFQMFRLIDWSTNKFIDILNPNQYFIGYFIVFLGLLAISILVSMFVIHFFLRAYWIGLVGLNSVFPDYGVEDSAYSKIYTEKILAILPKLKSSIQKVDELCSVIFSAAFTFLLSYAYMALSASIYLLIFNLLSDYISSRILLIPAYILALGMLFQVVVNIISNLKRFKQKKKLQILNFKIARLIYMAVYGPLYKYIMQVFMIFGSNFKKKKHIVYLLIIFVVSGASVSVFRIFNTNIPYLINKDSYFDVTRSYPQYYKSENGNSNFLLNPEIDSDKIESNLIKLFIPIFSHEKRMRNNICNSSDSNKISKSKPKKQQRKQLLDCYHKYNFVFINEEEKKVEFLRINHPITNQLGVICYIDISTLEAGLNKLTVKKIYGNDNFKEWSIPFYYLQ